MQNKKLTYDRDKQAEVLERYGSYYVNDVLSRFDQRCELVNKAFAEIVDKKQERLLNDQ